MRLLTERKNPVYYQDRGCQFSPSCQNCPLPRCIEEKGGMRAAKRALLREEIMNLKNSGIKVKEMVVILKLSQKQIYYLLKNNGNGKDNQEG